MASEDRITGEDGPLIPDHAKRRPALAHAPTVLRQSVDADGPDAMGAIARRQGLP